MKIKAVASWFGSKRTLAPEIVRQLGRHSYYFEGCCGSMSVLLAKEPSSHETVCDMHGGLTNLAWVVQREDMAVVLFNRLQRTLYSDKVFTASKEWLNDNDVAMCATAKQSTRDLPDADWAYHYFIASWMGRNGVSGTQSVNYQQAVRWTKGGGSGPLRFRNAVESIPEWYDRLRNVLVLRDDLFTLLPKIHDDAAAAIYVDPPYLPGTLSGHSHYLHDFSADDHRRLAAELCRFHHARCVVSYYADPLLAELYPGWSIKDCARQKNLHVQKRRGMGRMQAPEVLLVNGPLVSVNDELFQETIA